MADTRILQTEEDAERKSLEKSEAIGISFENIVSGEVRVCTTTEQIAAFVNSSDIGPNANKKQDFNWRLAPEDLVELENLKRDPVVMDKIASGNQIAAEDVADYNVLKYMANKRFAAAARERELDEVNHESDYDRRVREAREGKKTATKSEPKKSTPAKARTVNRSAKDGEFVSEKEAKANPDTTVKETVKPKDEEKLDNSGDKTDNSGNAK